MKQKRILTLALLIATVESVPGSVADAEDREARVAKCTVSDPLLPADEDFLWILDGKYSPFNGKQAEIGATAAAQAVRYNIETRKASVAAGAGGGISYRFYPQWWITPTDEGARDRDLRRIKRACRGISAKASWIGDDPVNGSLALPVLTASLVVFGAKQEDEDEFAVQPAFIVGFYRELIQLGIGFNLTDPGRGDPFLLIGLGVGLN